MLVEASSREPRMQENRKKGTEVKRKEGGAAGRGVGIVTSASSCGRWLHGGESL